MKRQSKILLFLGSGISRPSGLPSVDEITEDLFAKPMYFGTDKCFHSGLPPAKLPIGCTPEGTKRFLRLIKSYAERALSLRPGGETGEANYEDLYYLSRQIADDQIGEIENPAIEDFVRNIQTDAATLFNHMDDLFDLDGNEPEYGRPFGRLESGVRHSRLRQLAELACQYIECVVQSKLETPSTDSIKGFDVVVDLVNSSDLQRLDVVTLNHDLLVEKVLNNIRCEFTDGFERKDGGLTLFQPGAFDQDCKIRLLKLHGSIDWYRFRRVGNRDEIGKVTNGDPFHARFDDGVQADFLDGPHFLAGTFNKIYDYGSGIFAEQFYRFHQFLKEHETVVVSGYGFRDKGINARFAFWLNDCPARRMLVLHANSKELTWWARKAFGNMCSRFPSQIRIHESWMQNVSLEELSWQLEQFIPDS